MDTAGTGDTHETEETGDTSPPPEECPREEGLEITALEVGAPWTAHELSVDVITSAPAAVAVICTLDADPAERHLAESPEGTPPPPMRLAGLLPDATYSCEVAPTCPRLTGEPARFTHQTGSDPADMPRVTTRTWMGLASTEYILANQNDCWDVSTGLVTVYDRDGRPRWWYRTPDWVGPSIEFDHRGGTLFAWGGGWGPHSAEDR